LRHNGGHQAILAVRRPDEREIASWPPLNFPFNNYPKPEYFIADFFQDTKHIVDWWEK
jgi:hypothetical protein